MKRSTIIHFQSPDRHFKQIPHSFTPGAAYSMLDDGPFSITFQHPAIPPNIERRARRHHRYALRAAGWLWQGIRVAAPEPGSAKFRWRTVSVFFYPNNSLRAETDDILQEPYLTDYP